MPTPKDVLVLTTSTIQGETIKKYLKPVSAHLVAGTNLFTDFLGGLSDVFGGKSGTYQRQLSALYAEAINLIKNAAFEVGGNCVVGLSVDLDEISGKGKSMFMLTAVGTAVVIDRPKVDPKMIIPANDGAGVVSAETIAMLWRKQAIVSEANEEKLELTDEIWEFIAGNEVKEAFPYLLKRFAAVILNEQYNQDASDRFRRQLVNYLEALSEQDRMDLVYGAIQSTDNDALAAKLVGISKELKLFNADRIKVMLQQDNFNTKKRGLQLVRAEQPFYTLEDLEGLYSLSSIIPSTFPDRGTTSTKKQLLSSKEKQVWNCECGKSNDMGSHCSGCGKDIQGFKQSEITPAAAVRLLDNRAGLIRAALVPDAVNGSQLHKGAGALLVE